LNAALQIDEDKSDDHAEEEEEAKKTQESFHD
jgi:hypothetical protein